MGFIDDGVLFDDKVSLRSIPQGGDPRNFPRATDLNALKAAAVELRTAVLGVQPGFVDPNIAMVTASGGSAERALQSHFADVVNVKNFGAVGNGSTDDTAAIEAAIAAVQSSGGTLLFPPGNYIVSAIDNIGTTAKRVHLLGRGATITTALNHALVIAADSTGLTIEGFKFVSTGTGADGSDGLIRSYHHQLTDIAIRDCEFTAPTEGTNGVKLVHDQAGSFVKGLEISGCRFVNLGRMGVEVTNHVGDTTDRMSQIRITNNRFDGLGKNSTYGMGVSLSGPGRGAVVSGNTFEDTKDRAVEIVGPSDVSATGNTFRNLQASCNPITIAKTVAQTEVTNIAIVGNVVDDTTGNWSVQYVTGGVFSGNVYVGSGEVLFWNLSGMAISGNRLSTANDVWFQNVTDSTISGNRFVSTTASAGHPRVETCSRNHFVGNQFVSTLSYGLLVYSTSVDNSFVGNTFDNTAAATPFAALRFDGSGTTGNSVTGSTWRYSGGARWDQTNSAAGNVVDWTAPGKPGRVVMAFAGTLNIDASAGDYFEMTAGAGNTGAFAFAAPTNAADGMRITVSVRNTTGGALGGTDPFPVANGWRRAAWTHPPDMSGRTISFVYRASPAQWVQDGTAIEYVL